MPKKVSKIRSFFLNLYLGFGCLYFTFLGIVKNSFYKNTRENNNIIIKNFAHYILKPLKINFIYKNWDIINNLAIDKPIIFMSNHSSLVDIPIIIHAIPEKFSLRMLGKKEILKYPIFGKGAQKLEFAIIDRKNRHQALKDLETTKKLMQTGLTLWVSPEGTRSLDGKLLPFKKGVFIMAIEMGATIVPISIKNAHKVIPAKSLNYSLNETVELVAGPPLNTEKYSLDDRDKIMSIIRKEIESGL